MSARPISRERQVLDYLALHPEGARFGDLRLAIAPDIEVTKFAGTVSTLLRRKKITRAGRVRHYVYRASVNATIDRRKKVEKPVAATKPAAVPAPPAPAKRTAIATPPASVPVCAALTRVSSLSARSLRNDVEAKRPEREAIERDVAAFLAAGGRVQRFAPGESSKSGVSIAAQQAEFLAARGGQTPTAQRIRKQSIKETA